MATVATLRGPVDTAKLGTTYMHEHIFVLTPDLLQNYPDGWDEVERVTDAVPATLDRPPVTDLWILYYRQRA